MHKVKSLANCSFSDVVWTPSRKNFRVEGLKDLNDLSGGKDYYDDILYNYDDIINGRSKMARIGSVHVRADGSVMLIIDGEDDYHIPFRIRAELDYNNCKHLEIIEYGRNNSPAAKYVIDYSQFNTVITEYGGSDFSEKKKEITLKVSDPYHMFIDTYKAS